MKDSAGEQLLMPHVRIPEHALETKEVLPHHGSRMGSSMHVSNSVADSTQTEACALLDPLKQRQHACIN